jgi:hypothetical protein
MTTLNMRPGTVEMVPVEWLLNNLVGSADGFEVFDEGQLVPGIDFEEMIFYKGSDYGMGNVINAIVSSGFRVPICLYQAACGFTGWHMGNGHHRLTAAILLCLDAIPVYWSEYSDDFMCSHSTDTEKLPLSSGDYADIEALL